MPAPGSVLIDGRPIREFPIEFLRRNIGFVPQETFLFSDTVRENIAFGREDVTDAEIRSAAEAANIAADIESFPNQYATVVGERGLTLSGGQKQRTAIARAVIRNPRILTSTMPCPASTPRPRTRFSTTCVRSCVAARLYSSRIVFLPSAMQTASRCCTAGVS